jgi:hypothetical protein
MLVAEFLQVIACFRPNFLPALIKAVDISHSVTTPLDLLCSQLPCMTFITQLYKQSSPHFYSRHCRGCGECEGLECCDDSPNDWLQELCGDDGRVLTLDTQSGKNNILLIPSGITVTKENTDC